MLIQFYRQHGRFPDMRSSVFDRVIAPGIWIARTCSRRLNYSQRLEWIPAAWAVERVRDLDGVLQRFAQPQPLAPDQLAERFARYELHGDKRDASGLVTSPAWIDFAL